jgi:arsenate reductase
VRHEEDRVLRLKNVLFLCTGNSARSIMAEVMLNHLGRGRFRAHSAGSHPVGRVNPLAIETMQRMGAETNGLRSKNWEEFAAPGAPPIDFVITVCDNAAGEACPIWPGRPVTAHWGVADPAAIEGSDEQRRAAFRDAASALRRRIELLLELPMEKLDRLATESRLKDIGRQ